MKKSNFVTCLAAVAVVFCVALVGQWLGSSRFDAAGDGVMVGACTGFDNYAKIDTVCAKEGTEYKPAPLTSKVVQFDDGNSAMINNVPNGCTTTKIELCTSQDSFLAYGSEGPLVDESKDCDGSYVDPPVGREQTEQLPVDYNGKRYYYEATTCTIGTAGGLQPLAKPCGRNGKHGVKTC